MIIITVLLKKQDIIEEVIYAYAALLTSIVTSLASIFFIEIKGNPAAPLCWFERMLMFGVLLVLVTGILKKDKNVISYTIPFLFFGIPSSLYQQLVHWNVIPLLQTSCTTGFVCSTKFFNLFGFITQATICFMAFTLVGLFLLAFRRSNK